MGDPRKLIYPTDSDGNFCGSPGITRFAFLESQGCL